MKRWELFVDESGDFEPGKHCLIGGILCPEGTLSEATTLAWKHEILQDPQVQKAIAAYGPWTFDHCCENHVSNRTKSLQRNEIQKIVVEAYSGKVESIGGKLVIFDNPSGVFNVDNTTNFLTVLAKGLMMLFYDLRGEMASLKVRFAERRNNTRQDHSEQVAASPTRVLAEGQSDSATILPVQYDNVLRHLAFLHGGQRLLESKEFSDMLASIRVIGDMFVQVEENGAFIRQNGQFRFVGEGGTYDKRPNPLTVPCDYICNTFIDAKRAAATTGVYDETHCLMYRVDQPMLNDPEEDMLLDSMSVEDMLYLISTDFPEPVTAQFFRRMNEAEAETQRGMIDAVLRQIRLQVMEHKCMPLLASRLERTAEVAQNIDHEGLRDYFVANLLLFQRSLYTHLGNVPRVMALHAQAREVIDRLTDDADRDLLMDIEDNQSIVQLTDMFCYETAMEVFVEAEEYWKGRLKVRRRHKEAAPVYPQYGKLVGSGLQLLRHRIHASQQPDDREYYYLEAASRFEDYLHHLSHRLEDLSRAHQTISDIEAEMGHFDAAICHLYLAYHCYEGTEPEENEVIPEYVEIASSFMLYARREYANSAFLFLHFVRTLSLMIAAGEASAETLIKPLLPLLNATWASQIVSIHARTQVQWRTASVLASHKGSTQEERQLAGKLFDAAAKTLLRQSDAPILSAIAVGIRAEQLSHILAGRIAGNKATTYRALLDAYNQFRALKSENARDPFRELLNPAREITHPALTATFFVRIAALIGY